MAAAPSLDDLQSTAIEMLLQMNEIVEKTNKFHTDDFEKFVGSAVAAAKRMNPLVKKIYDLETAIGKFRSDVRRYQLLTPKAVEAEDPPIEVVEAPPPIKPKKTAAAGVEEKPAPIEKPPVKSKATVVPAGGAGEEKPAEKPVKPKAEKPEKAEKAQKADLKESVGSTGKDNDNKKRKEPKPPAPPVTTGGAAESSSSDDETTETITIKRKKAIPKHVKTLVWNNYVGVDKLEAKCFSCRAEKIDARHFHCGHVLAEAKGGDLTLPNLRPICAPCNLSMGTQSMNEFTKKFFGWEI